MRPWQRLAIIGIISCAYVIWNISVLNIKGKINKIAIMSYIITNFPLVDKWVILVQCQVGKFFIYIMEIYILMKWWYLFCTYRPTCLVRYLLYQLTVTLAWRHSSHITPLIYILSWFRVQHMATVFAPTP